MRRPLLLVALSTALALVACQIVAGIERVEKFDPTREAGAIPTGEAGADATPLPDPCLHSRPPDPPAVDDAPNDKLDDFYLGLRSVEVTPPPGMPINGFDLDGVCTCDTRADTAFAGAASCVGGKPHCDLDGGVDNQVVSFARDFSGLYDINKSANISGGIDQGEKTGILLISRFNGRANDKEIGVALFTSEGIQTPSPCPGSMPSGTFFTPGWCGEDTWTVTADSVNDLGTKFVPKVVGSGYVAGYQLVVKFAGVGAIPFGGYRLNIGSPVTRGTLVPLDDTYQPIDTSTNPDPATFKHWRLENTLIGGRIPASELVAAVGTLRTPGAAGDAGNGLPFCASPLFTSTKAEFCNQIDIGSTEALDFQPGVKCDAISVGLTVRADPVRVGAVVPAADAGNDCYPIADGGGPINGPPGVDYICP